MTLSLKYIDLIKREGPILSYRQDMLNSYHLRAMMRDGGRAYFSLNHNKISV